MEYSVEALAKLSRVSIRTLHYYDEIGLLKPLIRMANGRRYYGTQQFLKLQKILYFKEIGFSLGKIKSILEMKNLNEVSLLVSQKEVLIKEIKRLEKLTKSIDRTIEHYKGCKMSEQEICEQFENFQNKMKEQRKNYEERFGKEYIDESIKKVENMSQEEKESYTETARDLMKKVVTALNDNIDPSSEEAQALMKEQVEFSSHLTPMTKELCLKSRECYLDPNFISMYERAHPKLPEFLYEAMGVFINRAFPE